MFAKCWHGIGKRAENFFIRGFIFRYFLHDKQLYLAISVERQIVC